MSYLVRKIERARWNGCDTKGSRIKADVVASCIRPNASELSVWFAKDYESIPNAKLAMLAAMNKIASVDFVVLPLEHVTAAGLTVIETEPSVGPNVLKPLHRDIHDLDLDSLKTVAEIVQEFIGNKEACGRITLTSCKEILNSAIQKQLFPISELHVDIARKL